MESKRLQQGSSTGKIRPVVSLVSMTENPVGTLFSVWHGTRSAKSVKANVVQALYRDSSNIFTSDWYNMRKDDPDFSGDKYMNTAKELVARYPEHTGESGIDFHNVIKEVTKLVLKSNVPAGESVYFTFEIDNANVAWREQLVRGKHQQFWTQSTRTIDMTTMDVAMNDSIELIGGVEAVEIYEKTVEFIREAYRQLKALGVPEEDIRLQPQMHTHRVYWFISLRTLLTIINKRGDWIAQASLWTPIIAGVIKILRDKGLYDIVKDFIGQPTATISKDENGKLIVSNYINIPDCEDRMNGYDPLPIDPLYLAYTCKLMPEHTDIEFYDYMKSMFIQIWNDDVLEILGWDREHPDKLGPFDRP